MFGTAGLQFTITQSVYSHCHFALNFFAVSTPAIVLPNQHYDFLIGTLFMKQYNVTICHKENTFSILGQSIPLIYLAKGNLIAPQSVN